MSVNFHETVMTMDTFTAIDFETACHDRASICQVGLVRVESGEIVEELDILVQPPNNWYHPIFPSIHGINSSRTTDSPLFSQIWERIDPYINGQIVVAHNMSFDRSCLMAALGFYSLAVPEFEPECTYRIFGKALNVLCETHGILLNHHDALSDARACAQLYSIHLVQAATQIKQIS